MTPERFADLKGLFAAVADLPAAGRAARLRQLTPDEELIGEVLALYRAATGTTHLSTPIHAALASALCRQPAAGDTVGVWRIEREIGRGGMGSVFLAERSDGHFEQRAAVKLLGGLPHQEALALFTRERQLLATLTHPNIARLLDGGATPEGQPYLVMEYVDGAHIDEHCSREGLDIRAVLALFLTACDAVAFAHRQLIVHCDLKPSNLLIDREGRPVLLDFGIARLTDQVGADSPLGDTPASSSSPTTPAFTPRYASPEQRARGPISTASDIYSLGVLLGELLAQASDRAGLSALRLRELAAIVERAKREDPAERYANVDGLTADIRRFLVQQPVQALAGGPGYAARKLLVRRSSWVAMAAAFVLTVVGFTYRVVVESRRAQTAEQTALEQLDRARDAERRALLERDATRRARAEALSDRDGAEHARRESDRERDHAREAEKSAVEERNRAAQAEAAARQTSEFLVSIFDNSNPTAESGDIPASKLLARAGARLESELQGQGAAQAEIYSALARVEDNMGNPKEARAYSLRALAIERGRNRPLVLAEMLVRHAALIEKSFASGEEEPAAREALALRERYAPETDAHAEALALLASIFSYTGRMKEAERLLEQSLRIRRRIDPAGLGVAETLDTLGASYLQNRSLDRALTVLQESLRLREALQGTRHPDYLSTLEMYARALIATRRFAEAETALHHAVEERRRLHGNDSDKVAEVLQLLARLYHESGRPDSAMALYREALSIRKRILGPESVLYASTLYNIAYASQSLGDDEATVAGAREAIAILKRQFAERNVGVPRMRMTLARSLIDLGRIDEAKEELRQALATRLALLGEGHVDVLSTEVRLAECELRQNDWQGALSRLDRIASREPTLLTAARWEYRRLRALAVAAQGDLDGALRELEAVEAGFATSGEPLLTVWLKKIDRAELLVARGNAAQKAAGQTLARQILDAVTPQLVPQATVLGRLRDLLR